MPRREDERRIDPSGKHPEYCTCARCTESFLRKKGIGRGKGKKKGPSGGSGGEKVKPHPANCSCATCNLLRSVGGGPSSPLEIGDSVEGKGPTNRPKKGLLRRFLGRE
jgi:hypothetical protein